MIEIGILLNSLDREAYHISIDPNHVSVRRRSHQQRHRIIGRGVPFDHMIFRIWHQNVKKRRYGFLKSQLLRKWVELLDIMKLHIIKADDGQNTMDQSLPM